MRTWRQLSATIITSIMGMIIGLFLVSTTAQAAETVNHIQMLVQDPTGNPISGVPAYLYTSDDVYTDYTATNELGFVNYYSITDGTSYTIQIRPSQAYDCSGCSLLHDQDITFTASASEAVYDEATGLYTQTLDTVNLEQATRFVTVTVLDQDGNPAVGLYVSGWTNGGEWAYGTTDDNGQFQFAVDDDSTELWNIGAYPGDGGYTSTYEYDLEIESTGETAVAIEVTRADATIAMDILDSEGQPFVMGDTDYASVSCYDTASYMYYFYTSLNPGESSAEVDVVGGYEYQCSLWLTGYGSTSSTVTVESGETVAASITLLNRDAELTFQYIGEDGTVLDDVDSFSVYAFSTKDADGNENYSDYSYATGADGQATLSLVDGYTYQVSGYIYDSETGVTVLSGTTYINTYESAEIIADAANPQTVQVTLQAADATIDVHVLDSAGDPAQYAYVYAMEESHEEGSWGAYIGDSADDNGDASLGVSSGTNYTVYAYTMDSYVDGVLPPAVQQVTLESGETAELTMQSLRSDYTLDITTEVASTEGSGDDGTGDDGSTMSYEYAYCYAYSSTLGSYTFLDLVDNAGSMDLVSGYEWWIGCMSYEGDDFYRSVDTSYTPAAGETSGSLSITLQSAGTYYPETSYAFSATSANTITLPDGISTLTVPANAIADSGTVTLIVQTGTGYVVNGDTFPLTVYDFTALDANGNEVTDFASNLTLNLWYDVALLEEYGLTEEDLVGSAYDETNKQWEAPVSTTLDAENDILSITLSHFSLYGGVGDRGLSAGSSDEPNKPTKLKATKVKMKSAVLSWKKPAGTVSKYKVQLRKSGVKKVVKWKKYNSVKQTKKTVRKLKADTDYQFRVKACNSNGCSGFTKWKAFQTK